MVVIECADSRTSRPHRACGVQVGQVRRTILKREAERTLHHARGARRGYLSKLRVGLVAGRVEPGGGVDAGILGVIEGVVGFPAKLEIALLTRNRKLFGKR